VTIDIDGLQRGVALEALDESGSSFGTEVVPPQIEVGDACLVEDGIERSDALVSDVIASEIKVGDLRLLEDGSNCSGSLGSEPVAFEIQLLEHAILFDAARDDKGRGDAEPLAPEVDPLGRLRALELVDLEGVTVDTQGSDLRILEHDSDCLATFDANTVDADIERF